MTACVTNKSQRCYDVARCDVVSAADSRDNGMVRVLARMDFRLVSEDFCRSNAAPAVRTAYALV